MEKYLTTYYLIWKPIYITKTNQNWRIYSIIQEIGNHAHISIPPPANLTSPHDPWIEEPTLCLTYNAPNALRYEYIIQNHHINLRPPKHINHPYLHHTWNTHNHPYISLKLLHTSRYTPYSMVAPRNTKTNANSFKKKSTSYLCQWTLPNEVMYNKWLSQIGLFTWNNQHIINHNILLFTSLTYYKLT